MQGRVHQGFLVLADISGYTPFMAGTELEHSQAILSEFLDLLLGNLTRPLILAEVEGDAIFSYAVQENIERGETLLELIEATYVGFRDRRESMRAQTSCTCKACQAIPTLDLKYVIHFGEFLLTNVAGKKKPVGSDVNLAHRLLKNSVTEATDWRAYALFTEPGLKQLGLQADGMHKQVERYEHFGEVNTFSQDLVRRYHELKETSRFFITPEDADEVFTKKFPAPPAVVWDLLNNPIKRSKWVAGTSWTMIRPGGRTTPGSTNHCAHGKGLSIEKILDWRPFEYCTFASKHGLLTMVSCYQLIPENGGTLVSLRLKVNGPLPAFILKAICKIVASKVMNVEQWWTKIDELLAMDEQTLEPV